MTKELGMFAGGEHEGSWVQWRKGGCLTGWTQDVQSGQTWGVRSVALGQASSTDCRESVNQLRENILARVLDPVPPSKPD